MPGEREQVAEVLEKSTRLYDTLLQTTALGLLVMAKYDRAESQFGQTYVSAFLYRVFLILVAILAKLGGHDLLDIRRDALKP